MADESPLRQELDALLASRGWRLPICAGPARELLAELGDQPDRAQLAEVAASDPTLLASVLREANAARFDGLEPTAELDRALSRLGEERAEALLREVLTEARLEDGPAILEAALCLARRRALTVARSAEDIARATGHEALAEEVGKLGLLSELGTAFLVAALKAGAESSGESLTDFATREVLGQLHRVYGARLLELWRFPHRTVEILSERASDAEGRQLARILELGRRVVASAGLPAVGAGNGERAEAQLFELAESFELSNVELAALQVRAEDVVIELEQTADHPTA